MHIQQRNLSQPLPSLLAEPPGASLAIHWLGQAGFVIDLAGRRMVLASLSGSWWGMCAGCGRSLGSSLACRSSLMWAVTTVFALPGGGWSPRAWAGWRRPAPRC